MSTIRPLATIAVLAALGVFLAFKINEGPPVALNDPWDSADIADGEPADWPGEGSEAAAPTFPTSGGSTATVRSAPSWAESNASPQAEPDAPAFPAMPAMPPAQGDPAPIQGVPAGAELAKEPPAPAMPTASNERLSLPTSVPQASYQNTAPQATESKPPAISGRVPSLGSSTSDYSAAAPPQGAPGFVAAWQAIETALGRDELTRAHRMLSQWRREPALSPSQQQQVDTLLAQLAGSVVYSTEHRLEPPHVVAPGESLATIAEQYDVPWQLLAKINGVASPEAVRPGQTLKVLRGPFSAEVDLARGEMVLLLDDRYAGRFPVRVEGAALADGEWRVGQKRLEPSSGAMAEAVVPAPAPASAEPKVVLEGPAGEQFELSAGPTPPTGARGRLTVAANDLSDLYDILSIGSPVTVRR